MFLKISRYPISFCNHITNKTMIEMIADFGSYVDEYFCDLGDILSINCYRTCALAVAFVCCNYGAWSSMPAAHPLLWHSGHARPCTPLLRRGPQPHLRPHSPISFNAILSDCIRTKKPDRIACRTYSLRSLTSTALRPMRLLQHSA